MDERRKLKAEYLRKEREAVREKLALDEAQLRGLLSWLESELGSGECDHTQRRAERWCAERRVDAGAVLPRLAELGGYCDCEIVANVDADELFRP
jgi:hypothetical protein